MDSGKTLRLPERPRADHPSNRFSDVQVRAQIVGLKPAFDETFTCRNCKWPGSMTQLCKLCIVLLEAHEDMRKRSYWMELEAWEKRADKRRRRP